MIMFPVSDNIYIYFTYFIHICVHCFQVTMLKTKYLASLQMHPIQTISVAMRCETDLVR